MNSALIRVLPYNNGTLRVEFVNIMSASVLYIQYSAFNAATIAPKNNTNLALTLNVHSVLYR